jgi:hypothetical protein
MVNIYIILYLLTKNKFIFIKIENKNSIDSSDILIIN